MDSDRSPSRSTTSTSGAVSHGAPLLQTLVENATAANAVVAASVRGLLVSVESTLPSVTVAADNLLGEVFANVPANAIQHNDTDHPTVTVTTTVEESVVRVAVRDDGPEIPDAEKTRVFEKGMQGLASRRTGSGSTS